MDLNKNSFEKTFEYFGGESKAQSTPTNDEKLHTFIKLKNVKLMAKLGRLGKKTDWPSPTYFFKLTMG